MNRPDSRSLWLIAGLAVPPVLAGCSMTSTYGTGQAPEMALFREVSGGLLNKNEKKEPIEYQPRAPLVLPPSATAEAAQLPPPAETASSASPDWPVSPDDVVADVDARNEDDNPFNDVSQAEYRRLRPLSGVFPEQATVDRPTYDQDSGKTEYYNSIVRSNRQRDEFRQALADAKGYGSRGGERRYLTDPPLTYREPVAEAPGEAAVIPPKKKRGFFGRLFPGD